MAEAKRRRYTDEFKSEAVRLTRQSGKTVAQVARDLGISDNILYRWASEERGAEVRGTTRQAARAEAEELARLRRELDTVKRERDFLRRAAAFFAKEHK
jgi:transposase